MRPRILLACPQMLDLARSICTEGSGIELGEISWDRFPDGYPNILIKNVKRLKRAHVSLLMCFDSPYTIFEQISALMTLADLRPHSLKVFLPYYPTGTMERQSNEGQAATASTLARTLSNIPPAGPGSVPLYIWDIHALANKHFFRDTVSPQFRSGTKLLRQHLEAERAAGTDNISIAFPDDGAYKRFKDMFSDDEGAPLYPFIICGKRREGDKRIITITEGDVTGRSVVIVDDLIHSGGTLIECGHVLQKAGAERVRAYATHAVMEHDADKKFDTSPFDQVFITDTCPDTVKRVAGKQKYVILSIKGQIADAILHD